MAKKGNIYSATQLDTLKRELSGVVDYLQALDLTKITDDVDWKATSTGKVMPSIISTEEKIIETVVGEIKKSSSIITAIYDSEGINDILQYQIDVTVDKLNELQDYYFRQNINDLTHRKLEIPIGKDKQGNPKFMQVVAASKEDQIKARSRITENVMKILPMIDVIKGYKNVEARGGVEISEAMQRFLKRTGRL